MTPDTEPDYLDKLGRNWRLEFTIANARRILRDLRLDFVNAHNGKAIMAVSQDDGLLADVVWRLVEQQAKDNGLSEEQWAEGIDGAALGRAAEALGVAIVNFSPPARQPVMRAMLERADQAAHSSLALMAEKVRSDKLQPLMERIVKTQDANLDEAIQRAITGK